MQLVVPSQARVVHLVLAHSQVGRSTHTASIFALRHFSTLCCARSKYVKNKEIWCRSVARCLRDESFSEHKIYCSCLATTPALISPNPEPCCCIRHRPVSTGGALGNCCTEVASRFDVPRTPDTRMRMYPVCLRGDLYLFLVPLRPSP